MPILLDLGRYHADGQILDEVYEYGSFRQSLMFQRGVTCSNCHDPHSLELRAPGNAVCAQCHLPEKFDSVSHHHHETGSTGAQCANCHMPSQTYMAVDVRRDHAIRIPRPDLSVAIGTPNACNQCHTDRSPAWAAGPSLTGLVQNAAVSRIMALRSTRGEGGCPALATIWPDLPPMSRHRRSSEQQPSRCCRYSPRTPARQCSRLMWPDWRTTILWSVPPRSARLCPLRQNSRLQAAGPRLTDQVRAVRIEAARMLASVPPELMSTEQRASFEKASAELVDGQMASAERPEAHVTLGAFYAEQLRAEDAEAAYRTALRLDPEFVPAMVNLADLYRALLRDGDGEPLYCRRLRSSPTTPMRTTRWACFWCAKLGSQMPSLRSRALPNSRRAIAVTPMFTALHSIRSGGVTKRSTC